MQIYVCASNAVQFRTELLNRFFPALISAENFQFFQSYYVFFQVSTGKGIASYAVHVFVAVPEAFILGNGEYHIQQGSTINLVCIVEKVGGIFIKMCKKLQKVRI